MQIRAAKLDEFSQHALEGEKGFYENLKITVMFFSMMKKLLNPLKQISRKIISSWKIKKRTNIV